MSLPESGASAAASKTTGTWPRPAFIGGAVIVMPAGNWLPSSTRSPSKFFRVALISTA